MKISRLNARYFHGVALVTQKNVRIYYTKSPVLMFGFLFPLFLFLAFYFGRGMEIANFFPGLLAMFLFFISSSVGPLITPWEKIFRTYERLLSFPIDLNTIILGDAAAGMFFGVLINSAILGAGLLFLNGSPSLLLLILGILLGAFCFASLGVLLASPSIPNPATIMMISTLFRFPLVFMSGIFIPLEDLPGIGKVLSYVSPLTYVVDMFNYSFNGECHFTLVGDIAAILFFSMVFIFFSNKLHKKNLMKGL